MPRNETMLMDNWLFKREGEVFQTVDLPHDWAIDSPLEKEMDQGEAQGFFSRFGKGFYKKHFILNGKVATHHYFLDFGGIFENSSVLLNGKHVGGWRYGYSSFRLDVTEAICGGDNLLEVMVDSTASPADRWYSGCGIYRTVKLIETQAQFIDESELVVKTAFDKDGATVTVETGKAQPVSGTLTHGINTYRNKGEQGVLVFHVSNPALWTAETPELYELTINLLDGTDSVSLRIGIRNIVMDAEKGMLVNGVATKLKGTCVHQDVGCRGIAAKKEIWQERLKVLKDMGCNAIRLAHHTHSREMLDLCDEMGFYVYAEPFDKWQSGLYGRYFDQDWQKDMDAMLKRDRNHPCIVIWGVGNEVENQGQESMLQNLRMLTNYVKMVDDSRPVCYAMNPHFKEKAIADMRRVKNIQKYVDEVDASEIIDPHERVKRIAAIAAIVDVIGCNYQEQWYDLIHEACPDKVILGTETYQYFMGHMDQMQNLTDENPQLVPQTRNEVIGSMIWSGYDYLGESMGWPSKGWSGAPIRTNREKRPMFYVLKSYWTQAPMVHFSVMDYSMPDENIKAHWDAPMYKAHWDFKQFGQVVLPFRIASNCDEVQLYLNDKRFYLNSPCSYSNRVVTGFIPWIAGKVRAVGLNKGEVVCEHITITPRRASCLVFDKKEYTIPDEKAYEVLLTVRLLDEEGIPCLKQNEWVHFMLEGDGTILAVDNGCLMNTSPYQSNCVQLYEGAASVQLRINGDVEVTATAQEIGTAKTYVKVIKQGES